MASIHIQDENRTLTDVGEIEAFLEPHGIWYEHWAVDGRLPEGADNDQVLSTYDPEIQRLKEKGGFVTADVISVNPETPGLEEMLAKFQKEHTHSEDEVRFTIQGQGVFHIHPDNGPVFAVHVQSGDLINVPANTKHWFDLCEDKQIRCIRLFEDPAGWTPHYVDAPINQQYTPLCFGPDYVDDESSDIKPRGGPVMSEAFQVQAVLLDIEGTTSSVRFVYDVMFPMVQERLDEYLESHWGEPGLDEACDQIAQDAGLCRPNRLGQRVGHRAAAARGRGGSPADGWRHQGDRAQAAPRDDMEARLRVGTDASARLRRDAGGLSPLA